MQCWYRTIFNGRSVVLANFRSKREWEKFIGTLKDFVCSQINAFMRDGSLKVVMQSIEGLEKRCSRELVRSGYYCSTLFYMNDLMAMIYVMHRIINTDFQLQGDALPDVDIIDNSKCDDDAELTDFLNDIFAGWYDALEVCENIGAKDLDKLDANKNLYLCSNNEYNRCFDIFCNKYGGQPIDENV